MANKITLAEPEGPLRKGLLKNSEELGEQNGGQVFRGAYDLANAGLDTVLGLEAQGLGNSDISIPPPYQAVKVERNRGKFVPGDSLTHEIVTARM